MDFKLFIADDSKVLCKLLTEKLQEFENLEITGIAHNVSNAIKHIDTNKPDAAILDIQMPGGNGIEILEHIKKKHNATKVIIFTNYPYPQYRKKCEQVGADFFFDKHNEFKELFEVVAQLVKIHTDSNRLRGSNRKQRKTENKKQLHKK
jgi:DNA-binding NarL/FixJ family response regulator